MRYFLVLFVVACGLVMLVAGRRGDLSRRPPVELFDDMDRQLKLRPQTASGFEPWADSRSSRPWVPGTVPRLSPVVLGGKEIHRFEDHPVMTGHEQGKTNFVELNPLPLTARMLSRGKDRYEIYCLPCHGATGDGNGIVKKYGHATIPALIDEVRVKHPDGYLFQIIRMGSQTGLMGPYGDKLEAEDRWAVIAYVRALQLARLGRPEELPETMRASLK